MISKSHKFGTYFMKRKGNSVVFRPIFVFCWQKIEEKKSKKEDIIKWFQNHTNSRHVL